MSAAEGPLSAAAIVSVAGLSLTADEVALFQRERPLGFILFARNCDTPDQIRDLIRDLRATVNDPAMPVNGPAAPVLIDQEGGRVTRLKPPVWPSICALQEIGRLAV
ncbi:MAG: hypothetical protein ACR2OM_06345, partial [Aestuariivirgaceae bacterium]